MGVRIKQGCPRVAPVLVASLDESVDTSRDGQVPDEASRLAGHPSEDDGPRDEGGGGLSLVPLHEAVFPRDV